MKAKSSSRFKIVFWIIIIVVFIVLVGYMRYLKAQDKFVYNEHLEEVIVTVDDYDMTLREFGFYVYEVESFVQAQALVYNAENPLDYWNTHFSAGDDSDFMFNYALKVAMNNCVCDLVYEEIALKEGYSLTDEETQAAIKSAKDCYELMSGVQKMQTGLTQEDIEKVSIRKALAKKYVLDFSKDLDLTGYSGNFDEQISGGGQYFQEKILVNHTVIYNEFLMDSIILGQITVNQ